MRDSRHAAAIASVYALLLVAVSIASTPRRVGDGGEYFVMAGRLAAFENPALTRAELDDAKASLRLLGSGFDSALLDYPQLVGADGRQSFLHFWLYPLVATPGVWLASTFHLHPNWAFTFTNIALLAATALLMGYVVPAAGVIYALASPIVWWVDKAHTEVFLYATLSMAVVLIERRPAWAMVAYAAAAAQNAAIAATYPVFCCATLLLAKRAHRLRPRHWIGAVAGGLLIALPLFYNWVRLGRVAPMSEYAHFTVPSLPAMSGFVLEPNIGIAPAMPAYLVVVAGVALVAAWRRLVSLAIWWPVVIQLMLLFIWTQNPNANHGGTPGVNRWTLSLVPLTIPWAVVADTLVPQQARLGLRALLVAAATYTVYLHLPHHPENYLRPTALAQTLWAQGWLRMTSAEVFSERTAASETPIVPIADDRCATVLVWDMQWPLECVPPEGQLPGACSGVEAFCLAAQRDRRVDAVPASFNGFFFRPSPQSWPASGPLATAVRAAMLSMDPDAQRWQPASEKQVVGQRNAVDGLALLRSNNGLLVYIGRTGTTPLLVLRTDTPATATLHSLLPFREIASFTPPDNNGVLSPVLPPNASNLALLIRGQADR